jgi:hypothetical protein
LFFHSFSNFVKKSKMNKFVNRLKYYGVGFGIGMVFVFFFFQNRGCSWLPANRVKNSILDRALVVSEEENKVLSKKGVKIDDIIELLNTGDVDFEKSITEGKTKIYYLSNDKIKVFFTLPKDNYISEVKYAQRPVSKVTNTLKGKGKFLHFPNDPDLIYVDSNKVLGCQQEVLGFINQKLIFKAIKESGEVDFDKTFYFKKPRPICYINYKDAKGNMIGSKTYWYKNKITIKSFDIPFENSCK